MNFDYDIFISFAQSDKSGVDIEWSLKFCNLIDNMLNKMTNEKPVIITSADIEARVNMFHITKEEIYSKSAVFVIILSEESMQDTEFLYEMEQFSKYINSQKDGLIEKSMRVFKIMSSPIVFNLLPDFLKFETSYNFYETNLINGRTQIFNLSYASKKDNVFWSRLVDLSYDLGETIKILKQGKELQIRSENPAVYLAATTPDQEECRDIIRRDLKQLGYTIYPDFELPEDSRKFKEIVFDLIQKSKFSFHIMGGYYGKYLEEIQFSAIEFQNKIVTEYLNILPENSSFERIIWISSDMKVKDQKQRLYLGRMKRDETINSSEIIECPLEDIKSIIDNKLYKSEETNKLSGNKLLFFQYPSRNDNEVQEIIGILENLSFEIITSGMLEQKDILQKYWDKLLEADYMLFYYNGNKNWLDFKIKDAVKVKGYRSVDKDHKIIILTNDENEVPDLNISTSYDTIKLKELHTKLKNL